LLTLKSDVLDFDEFMEISNAVGAEPILVVAYDCMYKKAVSVSRMVPTKEKLLKNAEEWVRYANIKKKYGVKYWMIGNESYKNCDYNGCATATQYRDDVIEFSRRMKKIDPDIKIIANGEDALWWATMLPGASAHIDYLGLSNYPVWNYPGGYDYYRTNNPDFMEVVNTASDAINALASAEDRERIKVIVTEFNAIDWAAGWENKNDLGHALFCFEMLGQHLNNPMVVSSNFWNTRWVTNSTTAHQVSDALNKNGKLNANGKILALWGNYLLPNMIGTTSTDVIRTFASMDPLSQKLNIFLVNKESTSQQINISLLKYLPRVRGERWEFAGTGPEDVSPVLMKKENFEVSDPVITLQVPATSITILELEEAL
jgi:alpha-L-arabinofuranosidase